MSSNNLSNTNSAAIAIKSNCIFIITEYMKAYFMHLTWLISFFSERAIGQPFCEKPSQKKDKISNVCFVIILLHLIKSCTAYLGLNVGNNERFRSKLLTKFHLMLLKALVINYDNAEHDLILIKY